MNDLYCYQIKDFTTSYGVRIANINIYYQLYGCPIGEFPVIVINHALTGNSQLTGKTGWWDEIVGSGKTIDTDRYTVLAMNIPGNGYGGYQTDNITNYLHWAAIDIAKIFNVCIKNLGIENVFALLGCSLGGGLAWEMIALEPHLYENLIIIASDWKASDWVIGNCLLQEQILKNSNNPLHDARLHAMLCYRTPKSLKMKFERSTHSPTQLYNVESWLLHHGDKLLKRFSLSSYKLMNQLLKTIDISKDRGSFARATENINSNMYIISVDSDLFFVPEENQETVAELKLLGKNVQYHEIKSVHGHDAFLIENEQLIKILKPIFK